jgi:hypothetical protein
VLLLFVGLDIACLQLRRVRATCNVHRELPVVSMGQSVENFFQDVEHHTDHGAKLPNWFVGVSLFLFYRFGINI